ncbi:MAG TPA: biosynthetic arginine decarboxylase [Gammaproteobacteria bacterium]|jgi:arginine decarboxylase
MVAKIREPGTTSWSVEQSSELYRIGSWGEPYFFVNEHGHMAVHAHDDKNTTLDIVSIVDELRRRGVKLPVLIRFQDILSAQVRRLNEAFAAAIAEAGYGNVYRGVYPIKVNQLHEVVDEILDAGRPFGLGLECGSKAELIAALPQIDQDTLLVCNGVKDRSMLSLMLAGQQLGQNVVPVVERMAEFDELLSLAEGDLKLGVRVRLATRGSGRWSESSGVNSKFGLNIAELVKMLDELERRGLEQSLSLLHCHIGSQIADIQVLKQATKEITRIYVEISRRGFAVEYLDLGGGLGVNYDKGHYEEDASINYSLQEYANAIVCTVGEVCQANDVPPPILVTESGRAMTAHHSALIVPVLSAQPRLGSDTRIEIPPDAAEPVRNLEEILGYVDSLTAANDLLEAYHDANERLEEVRVLFSLGYLDLEQQAVGENIFWRIASIVRDSLENTADEPLPEKGELERLLTDQYLCDFSVFQSMLDHWAIGQPFPIVPIERLDEKPERRAKLVDLTCDSDGTVRHYVSNLPDNYYLPLHALRADRDYFLGFFLMGAYEDIVGDAHNLFGGVAEAHVYADPEEPGNFWIEKVIEATAVRDMLAQVQYFPNDLHRRMSELVRARIREGAVRPGEGMRILDRYMACFGSNTYCDLPTLDRADQ